MYTQADREALRRENRKRAWITLVPGALLLAVGIGVFVACQQNRQDWGWVFACACTLFGGFYVLLMDGMYWKPARLYQRHVSHMLDGRKRETTGILQEMAIETTDKDGLACYALTVNVGEKGDAQDERLFYYDARMGRPDIPLGTLVTVQSNDKMVADIQKAAKG